MSDRGNLLDAIALIVLLVVLVGVAVELILFGSVLVKPT